MILPSHHEKQGTKELYIISKTLTLMWCESVSSSCSSLSNMSASCPLVAAVLSSLSSSLKSNWWSSVLIRSFTLELQDNTELILPWKLTYKALVFMLFYWVKAFLKQIWLKGNDTRNGHSTGTDDIPWTSHSVWDQDFALSQMEMLGQQSKLFLIVLVSSSGTAMRNSILLTGNKSCNLSL